MIEIDPDEVEALNRWNCAMLNKRRNRKLKCRTFNYWKQLAFEAINSKTQDEEISIFNRNTSFKSISSGQSQNQTLSRTNRTTDALKSELDSLLREQSELENSTEQIKATLRNLPRASTTFRNSTYTTSFTTTTQSRRYGNF
ncbi:hypothetical protein TVAG_371260 [Trichomonas vaginalis G3]|uniref:Uncharacterized protein n=1 Tax=Trichomonas vaginalis (strain ATCC PRA-98 / G3) TaxID=412133 RepID=A2FYE8_TRIV3|nr:hypothetical protein TVAGG3_0477670 [Trichomonas vaginalis G3]EAX90065.1 hypothetical protein TVAG_371260 [Trichomonas vaginalis G3]KAI5515517.1 hypothetical protein TVAGG3_0477670 [Trichomonas vaginalis G3]|eukprot:XP_001302995.1 hypothetical protein [Trichomonas vaginalis G3]